MTELEEIENEIAEAVRKERERIMVGVLGLQSEKERFNSYENHTFFNKAINDAAEWIKTSALVEKQGGAK